MYKLKVKLRDLGKKTNQLRNTGFIPGCMYGPSVDNTPVKLKRSELDKVHRSPGEVHEVMTSKGKMMVKFDEIQIDPITHDYIHFSLVELPKSEMTNVQVPLKFKGTPVGVQKGGVFVVVKDEVTAQGTPRRIPEDIKMNISSLDIGEKILAKDIHISDSVELDEDKNEVIAVCQPPALQAVKDSNQESINSHTEGLDLLANPAFTI